MPEHDGSDASHEERAVVRNDPVLDDLRAKITSEFMEVLRAENRLDGNGQLTNNFALIVKHKNNVIIQQHQMIDHLMEIVDDDKP